MIGLVFLFALLADKPLPPPKADCGPACLYVLLVSHSINETCSYSEFVSRIKIDPTKGTSILDLSELARTNGLEAVSVSCGLKDIRQWKSKYSVIALVNGNHFVIVDHIGTNYIDLIDANFGTFRSSLEEFENRFSGKVLLVSGDPIQIADRSWTRVLLYSIAVSSSVIILYLLVKRFRRRVLVACTFAFFLNGCGRITNNASVGTPDSRPIEFLFLAQDSTTTTGVTNRLIDLGKTPRLDEYKLTLIAHNRSKNPVKIKAISQSCQCLSVSCDSTEIEPNKSIELGLILRGNSSKPSSSTLRIQFEQPVKEVEEVVVKWHPKPVVHFPKEEFELGELNDTEGALFEINDLVWEADFQGSHEEVSVVCSPREVVRAELSQDLKSMSVRISPGNRAVTEGSVAICNTRNQQLAFAEVRWSWKSDSVLRNRHFLFSDVNPPAEVRIEIQPANSDFDWSRVRGIHSNVSGLKLISVGNQHFLSFEAQNSEIANLEDTVFFELSDGTEIGVPIVITFNQSEAK